MLSETGATASRTRGFAAVAGGFPGPKSPVSCRAAAASIGGATRRREITCGSRSPAGLGRARWGIHATRDDGTGARHRPRHRRGQDRGRSSSPHRPGARGAAEASTPPGRARSSSPGDLLDRAAGCGWAATSPPSSPARPRCFRWPEGRMPRAVEQRLPGLGRSATSCSVSTGSPAVVDIDQSTLSSSPRPVWADAVRETLFLGIWIRIGGGLVLENGALPLMDGCRVAR